MPEALLCSRCGAPLDVEAAASEARCTFCGTTTRLTRGAIADEAEARALAKAIVADIALWGAFDASTAEETRSSEVAKGRGLFQRRVAPALHTLFDDEVARRSR